MFHNQTNNTKVVPKDFNNSSSKDAVPPIVDKMLANVADWEWDDFDSSEEWSTDKEDLQSSRQKKKVLHQYR